MRPLFATTFRASPHRGMILEPETFVPESSLIELPAAKPVVVTINPTRPQVPAERVSLDGKFFRVGGQKFCPKGVTYGPFKPDATGGTFPTPAQTARDFKLIQQLNANCVRVYHVPPRWFLDLAAEHDLKVLVDYYWPKHTCF